MLINSPFNSVSVNPANVHFESNGRVPSSSFSKVATVYTSVDDTTRYPCLTSGLKRSVFIVDIERGVPNYVVQAWSCRAEHIENDVSLSDFISIVNQSGDPMVAGKRLQSSGRVTMLCNESTGAFNAINVSWNLTAFLLLHAVAVGKLG